MIATAHWIVTTRSNDEEAMKRIELLQIKCLSGTFL